VAEAGDRGEEWGHNGRRTAAAPSLFLLFVFFSERRGAKGRGGEGVRGVIRGMNIFSTTNMYRM